MKKYYIEGDFIIPAKATITAKTEAEAIRKFKKIKAGKLKAKKSHLEEFPYIFEVD